MPLSNYFTSAYISTVVFWTSTINFNYHTDQKLIGFGVLLSRHFSFIFSLSQMMMFIYTLSLAIIFMIMFNVTFYYWHMHFHKYNIQHIPVYIIKCFRTVNGCAVDIWRCYCFALLDHTHEANAVSVFMFRLWWCMFCCWHAIHANISATIVDLCWWCVGNHDNT